MHMAPMPPAQATSAPLELAPKTPRVLPISPKSTSGRFLRVAR